MATATARQLLLFSPLAAAVVLIACSKQSGAGGVIEAPMTSVDASAAAIALVRDHDPLNVPPLDDSSGAPFRVGDRWVGHYNCAQGKTELTLIFEELGASAKNVSEEDMVPVVAIFEFHFDGNGNQGFGTSDGAARMRGRFEPKTRRLLLKGDEWIEQPANYKLINLVGMVSKAGTYSGTVEGPGCTTFFAGPEKNSADGIPRGTSGPIAPPRSLPRPRP